MSISSDHITEEADFEVQFHRFPSPCSCDGSRVKKIYKSLCRIEVMAFLQTLALGLQGVIQTNLMIEKTCRVDFNFTDDICANSDQHKNETDLVQEQVTTLNLYFTFLSAIPWYSQNNNQLIY